MYKTSLPGYFLWPTRPAAPYRGQSWMWGERALSTSSTNTLFDPSRRLPTHSHSYPSRRKNQLQRIRLLLWVSQRARSMLYVMQRTRQGFLSNTHTHMNKRAVSTNHCLINQTEFLLLFQLHCIANTSIHKKVCQWQEAPDRSDRIYIYISFFFFHVSRKQ